ncbi:preprotein translocase subunit SecA [Paenibacillus sp. 1182]|nr:preprotein translocase subunit SecA [Paenibacillus sp. 1182]
MNLAVKLMQKFKDRDTQNKLKGYRDKAELIRKRNLEAWDDQRLKAESLRLKKEAESGTPLDELLVDAYALVCEAAKRKLGLQPYDVQIMAAIALHERFVIEQQYRRRKNALCCYACLSKCADRRRRSCAHF